MNSSFWLFIVVLIGNYYCEFNMIKSASIYLLSGILNRAIPFLLLPVLTNYLAPEEYGTLAVFQVLLAFTTPLVGMNMQINIARNFGKFDRDEMARLIGMMTGMLCVSAGILGLFATLWVAILGPFCEIPGLWILILPLVACLSTAHQFNMVVLLSQERPFSFGGFEVSNTIFELSLSLILVVGLGLGWQGRAFGVVGAAGCLGLVGLVALRRQKLLVFEFDRKVLTEVLRISVPLIPHVLGSVVIALSDRLFIDRMIGKEALGLYAVGYAFGMIVNLAVEASSRAWGPWFYREMTNATEEGRKRIVKFTYTYFGCVLLLAAVITGFSYLILPYMVAVEYQAATQFILWIAVGYAFRGMYTMVFPYLIHAAKTNFLGGFTLFVAGLNLALNYALISLNGAVGAAQATVISFALSFLGTWWYASRICPMPWRLWRNNVSPVE
jgi:O-antigen/teichoic acid export membrane protein